MKPTPRQPGRTRLYITVETTSRELEGKTLLACQAAAEGFDVVIGLEDMVRRLAMIGPQGIFYDKSTHSEYPGVFAAMRRMGHLVAVNDEEGLIVIPERYRSYCLTEQAQRTVDVLFTWGEHQKRIVSAYRPQLGERSVCVGNARMDLLRRELRPFHQESADRIRREHGSFVLINTRCGIVNNVDGAESIKRRIDAGRLGPADIMQRFFERDMKMFHGFQDMVRAVSARFPEKIFIVRPHPSESLTVWERIAGETKNVRVVRQGNVHQWILASDLVIQHGCSTAVESFFLDTPCLSYHPVVDEEIVHGLPDAVSYNVHDLETLCACIAGERDHEMEALRPVWTEHVRDYIASVDGPLAVTETVRHLQELACRERRPDRYFALGHRIGGRLRSWHRLARQWLRVISGRVKPVPGNAKWKPMSVDDFSTLVRRFSFVDSRFDRLEISQAYLDCFRIRLP